MGQSVKHIHDQDLRIIWRGGGNSCGGFLSAYCSDWLDWSPGRGVVFHFIVTGPTQAGPLLLQAAPADPNNNMQPQINSAQTVRLPVAMCDPLGKTQPVQSIQPLPDWQGKVVSVEVPICGEGESQYKFLRWMQVRMPYDPSPDLVILAEIHSLRTKS